MEDIEAPKEKPAVQPPEEVTITEPPEPKPEPKPEPTPEPPSDDSTKIEKEVQKTEKKDEKEKKKAAAKPVKSKEDKSESKLPVSEESQQHLKKREPSSERKKFPANKPVDFQVRVRVIQGRQIAGTNLSPVVKVTVGNQARQTKVKKSTDRPYYDEMFFFNYNQLASEFFDSLIMFEVFNSRKLRSNALIGNFTSDVGFFYDRPDHIANRAWVLLTDPEDKMEGAKGYLKVTVMVLGPGDEAPVMSESTNEDDEDDLEDNLLQPAGVMLRPAVFSLKVYRAEDIPQMDSSFTETVKSMFRVGEATKELVDPYVLVSFAGKQSKSRRHEKCDHPEFNEELFVRFRIPSMCEKLKLQMFDWDRITADDCIGTSYLPLSAISGQTETEGFLPTFGPCYVNFYGSTREYSDLPDEYDDLNEGIGEGVAYRGRLLLELDTKLGAEVVQSSQDMAAEDTISIQPFLRRRKYKLFACFLEATMIACADSAVQFEISIGNYGNRLDTSVDPSSSSTASCNAIFDGCYYYFLPWADSKPCCSVDSHWEDISFRLEALNLLTRTTERLQTNIEKLELAKNANLPTPDLAALVIRLLEELIEDCSRPLPEVTSSTPGANDLDFKRYEHRKNEKQAIAEEAKKLHDSATDIEEALAEIEQYQKRLEDISIEPQNSMPDVVIWMLSGNKRIAYHRIPAHKVLHSQDQFARGEHCGKVHSVFLKYPGKKQFDVEDHPEIPCKVDVVIWLGRERDQQAWIDKSNQGGQFSVYAETYENLMKFLGKWTSKVAGRPSWSNLEGTEKLPKDNFTPPAGWSWDGDWFINPERSADYDQNTGHKSFMEDVFENQSRLPGGNWAPANSPWTDIHGNDAVGKDEVTCPEGWEWIQEWSVDMNRAVDEDGFEYSVDPSIGTYVPVEKTYHLNRRRRWVRSRKVTKKAPKPQEQKDTDLLADGGWEYAPSFSLRFHNKERPVDMVKRRRWHRKMLQKNPTAPAVFQRHEGSAKDNGGSDANAPRMFITYERSYKFQLRVYIFQGRDLLASDSDGLADPYARVVFQKQSQVTSIKPRTLCPTWDQTLIFEGVAIYRTKDLLVENPPKIVIELFDKDQVGKDEFMGRCVATPDIKLSGAGPPAPRLLWYPVTKGTMEGGEVLAAFELFLDEGADLPYFPPMKQDLYMVPSGIRPVVQRTAVEVLCWGVRNMKKFQLASVSSPSIEFECGGHVVNSTIIKNTQKNPNFDQPLFFFDVYLPKEELYTPPMNIKVRDNRSFGRRPIVGVHCVKSLRPFRCEPLDEIDDVEEEELRSSSAAVTLCEIDEGDNKKLKKQLHEDIDWWSKFYASIGETEKAEGYLETGNDKIIIYKKELERVEEFKGFQDFVMTFPVYRGKADEDDEMSSVGEFKGTFRVYPLPSDPTQPLPPRILRNLPSSSPVECIVRVYVLRALDLQPMDSNGLADPYIVVRLGKQKISDQDNYIANSLNPVFGKMFELTASVPIAKDLTISVMDWDFIGKNDVIGETTVDLENRLLSRFRPTCGIPQSYCTSGPNTWRDAQKPKQILAQWAETMGYTTPKFYGNTKLYLNGRFYTLGEFEDDMPRNPDFGPPDERLALHVLNGLPLVPEHVETRPLYSTLQPNIEQGKLQMWVDVFPKELGEPGLPFDISPRVPQEYELRVIIWNTSDVILEETSVTGEAMSDIYVKGWLAGIDDIQKTDVHFRSLDGTGNFNWRFIFPFSYVPAEKVLVLRKKRHIWSLDTTEERFSPRLVLQVWDNDIFSPDDFLGQIELNLNRLPKEAKSARNCGLKQLPFIQPSKGHKCETVSLFQMRRLMGWWPVLAQEDGEYIVTGKVEMTLEIVNKGESDERPAGKARADPNLNPTLEPPNRPATSFSWFSSPFKSLYYIIWRRYKYTIIATILFIIFAALVVLFVYSMPGYTVKKLFGV